MSDVADEHLIERDNGVQLADTYEATLCADLIDRYALSKVLTGTKEDVLRALLSDAKTIGELQQAGFAKSALYEQLIEHNVKHLPCYLHKHIHDRVVIGQ